MGKNRKQDIVTKIKTEEIEKLEDRLDGGKEERERKEQKQKLAVERD